MTEKQKMREEVDSMETLDTNQQLTIMLGKMHGMVIGFELGKELNHKGMIATMVEMIDGLSPCAKEDEDIKLIREELETIQMMLREGKGND